MAKLISLGPLGQKHAMNGEAGSLTRKDRVAMVEHLLHGFGGEGPADKSEEEHSLSKFGLLARLVESVGLLCKKRVIHKVSGKEAEYGMVQDLLAFMEESDNAALEEETACQDAVVDVTDMAMDQVSLIIYGRHALKKQRVG